MNEAQGKLRSSRRCWISNVNKMIMMSTTTNSVIGLEEAVATRMRCSKSRGEASGGLALLRQMVPILTRTSAMRMNPPPPTDKVGGET